ncbi:MAG: hypothetical protein JXR31_04845, partial [Prolixibacteraceae bacterium]|nr:hypothetical protein [Prolixibacteraceae bacterium]
MKINKKLFQKNISSCLKIVFFIIFINSGFLKNSQGQNSPPVFTSEPDTVIENNQTYYYNINVNDPDGDFTTVSAPLLP